MSLWSEVPSTAPRRMRETPGATCAGLARGQGLFLDTSLGMSNGTGSKHAANFPNSASAPSGCFSAINQNTLISGSLASGGSCTHCPPGPGLAALSNTRFQSPAGLSAVRADPSSSAHERHPRTHRTR